jgi:hypothetical protein
MTAVGGTSGTGLVGRVVNILTKPASEWDVIDTESASIGSLYTGYAMILAAIPAIASIIGGLVFLHWGVIVIAVVAVLSYVAQLIGVFVSAFIIDALAPSFGGTKNQIQALKLTVYSATAGWVAGILGIMPPLALLVWIGSLYGLYIMFLGLPKMMKSPADKTVGYFVVSLVCVFVVNIIIGAVIAAVSAAMVLSAGAAAMGAVR